MSKKKIKKTVHNILKQYLGDKYELEAKYFGLYSALSKALDTIRDETIKEAEKMLDEGKWNDTTLENLIIRLKTNE